MGQKRSNEHRKAQREGKELDAYMCFFCNKVDLKNHGHHIILFSEDGNGSTDNIITLCPNCHRDYHAGRIKIDIGRF
ncbi:HNH endonuclease [Pseudomonas viridiflava]|jgi:5-methylcytosine-specific restriction endonuclease McrA|uniref:HNH endonuclease n=1 Tax=Pseudomonas viridiflava TaxID=33069 RepID=UPI0039B8E8DD